MNIEGLIPMFKMDMIYDDIVPSSKSKKQLKINDTDMEITSNNPASAFIRHLSKQDKNEEESISSADFFYSSPRVTTILDKIINLRGYDRIASYLRYDDFISKFNPARSFFYIYDSNDTSELNDIDKSRSMDETKMNKKCVHDKLHEVFWSSKNIDMTKKRIRVINSAYVGFTMVGVYTFEEILCLSKIYFDYSRLDYTDSSHKLYLGEYYYYQYTELTGPFIQYLFTEEKRNVSYFLSHLKYSTVRWDEIRLLDMPVVENPFMWLGLLRLNGERPERINKELITIKEKSKIDYGHNPLVNSNYIYNDSDFEVLSEYMSTSSLVSNFRFESKLFNRLHSELSMFYISHNFNGIGSEVLNKWRVESSTFKFLGVLKLFKLIIK